MRHVDQVLALLAQQIGNDQEVQDIKKAATKVAKEWVDPLSGGKEETNGLLYGLVQSGKTGVLSVTGAIGADEGYKTILILTSDNDALYDQTLGRVAEAFPGMDILGKEDIRDQTAFLQRIKSGTCAIVMTKNSSHLETLIENFQKGNLKGLSCLIIDDEADQASLNTFASQNRGRISGINDRISQLRRFFDKNTYLQVTATPQALFLQAPGHDFRPKFTVLSHPGRDYVGGEDFFGDGSALVREFPIADIMGLTAGNQPSPTLAAPSSLIDALDTFIVAATYKRLTNPEYNSAFLCHVSTKTADHNHIVRILRDYKSDLQSKVKKRDQKLVARLKRAYDELATTQPELKKVTFDKIVEAASFYSPGVTVKLVNGETDEDVALRSPYNLFVGGNKLGRGVTIKNLLVSYYGRNPRTPQADTVLQHARMYGYRRKDIGLLRLYLPAQLHTVFKSIYKMENALRDLIEKNASQDFRGVFLEGRLRATRRNVLVPGAVGVYTASGSYNPAQVLRTNEVKTKTAKLDRLLQHVADKTYVKMTVEQLEELLSLVSPDENFSEAVWDTDAIIGAANEFKTISKKDVVYVYVDRERGLKAKRRETQGVIEGNEGNTVPRDAVTLFMLRTKAEGGDEATWWPQVRLPPGSYAFAFAI